MFGGGKGRKDPRAQAYLKGALSDIQGDMKNVRALGNHGDYETLREYLKRRDLFAVPATRTYYEAANKYGYDAPEVRQMRQIMEAEGIPVANALGVEFLAPETMESVKIASTVQEEASGGQHNALSESLDAGKPVVPTTSKAEKSPRKGESGMQSVTRKASLRQFLLVSAVLLAGIAFYYFIWPTPYEYTRDGKTVIRVNRFSGVRAYGSESGWSSEPPSNLRTGPGLRTGKGLRTR